MSPHDAQPAAAETPSLLSTLKAAVEPVARAVQDRRRPGPARALVFEAMPWDGRIEGRVGAAAVAMRLNFVPLSVLGEPAADPVPAPIRVQRTGWSVREQRPHWRTGRDQAGAA